MRANRKKNNEGKGERMKGWDVRGKQREINEEKGEKMENRKTSYWAKTRPGKTDKKKK